MDFSKPAVVIDLGGHTVKAGFCCDNFPVSMFRNLLGRPPNLDPQPYGRGPYEVPIGDDAVLRGEGMDLHTPLVNGVITEWENIERIFHHIYYRELRVAPEDRPVMMCCSPIFPMLQKIKCCQIFFEVLNCPAMCIQPTSVLSLYGSGLTTGCTVDLGFDTVDVNPAFDGCLFKYAHGTTGYAGKEMENLIAEYLAERDLSFGYQTPQFIDTIIRNCVYVSSNASMSLKNHHRYAKTSDGEEFSVSNESFMAGEMFFQPDLIEGPATRTKSLPDVVVSALMKIDSELREEILEGIVVSGGLSMIPGLTDRLQAILTERLKKKITLHTSSESNVLGWMGGALFAGIPEAVQMWITRSQYDDYGARIIRNKFM